MRFWPWGRRRRRSATDPAPLPERAPRPEGSPETQASLRDQPRRIRVLLVHAELGQQLQALRLLQLELTQRGAAGAQARMQAEQLTAAIEHVEAAMAALMRVGTS